MSLGLIGIKKDMISFYKKNNIIPVTKIKIINNYIIKYIYNNNYKSILIGYCKKNKINKPTLGIIKKLNISCSKFKEFKIKKNIKYNIGDKLNLSIFKKNKYVNITANNKGKGFQGVIKRYNFSGVGGQTHGQHNRLRTTGSIGAGSSPSRVFKGKKMPGKMGNKKTTIRKLKIYKLDIKNNYLFVKGSIPGFKNKYVIINKYKSCIY
ncbi:MAG: 50S ribosomal protein L3 [Candidatus Shikimatogenerans sp. Tser]|uniref:50S ribosomal protein L3 n=1 Tax=Candidatus Shikimatogenerans sp. Tser TaxID=3158568 RepID=A0AAU7QSU4_9FLAO